MCFIDNDPKEAEVSETEARARAIAVTGENVAWRSGLEPVVINDADITFPAARRCRVRTHRTAATGDAVVRRVRS